MKTFWLNICLLVIIDVISSDFLRDIDSDDLFFVILYMHEVVEGYLEHCHESFGDNIPAAKICFRAVLICLLSGNG